MLQYGHMERHHPSGPLPEYRQLASLDPTPGNDNTLQVDLGRGSEVNNYSGNDFFSTCALDPGENNDTSPRNTNRPTGFLLGDSPSQIQDFGNRTRPSHIDGGRCLLPALFAASDEAPSQHYAESNLYETSCQTSNLDICFQDAYKTKSKNEKRKRPYVPHYKRRTEVVDRRNERERNRMGTMQTAFKDLQKHLPVLQHCSKRIPKERILRVATNYIQALKNVLSNEDFLDQSPVKDAVSPLFTFLPAMQTSTSAPNGRPVYPLSSATTVPASPANTNINGLGENYSYVDILDFLNASLPSSDSDQSQLHDSAVLEPDVISSTLTY